MFIRMAANMSGFSEIRDFNRSSSYNNKSQDVTAEKCAHVYHENCEFGGGVINETPSLDVPVDRKDEIHPSGQTSENKYIETAINGSGTVISGVEAVVSGVNKDAWGAIEHSIEFVQGAISTVESYTEARTLETYEVEMKEKNDRIQNEIDARKAERTENDRRSIEQSVREGDFYNRSGEINRNDDHGFMDRSYGMDRW